MRLQGKVAIITGGANGIGKATAARFLQEGAHVAIWDINEVAGKALATTWAAQGASCKFYRVDTANLEAVTEMAEAVARDFGQIDILVNNAGITRDATMVKMTFEQWDEVIRVDLTGCFNMAKAVFAGMRERKWGRIVNVGSVNGQGGQIGQVNYAAAKSGIHGFTKSLAMEGARFGVTANAIAPGYIATEMLSTIPENVMEKIVAQIPIGRLGQADEIARGVEFLTSDNAGFITGSTLSINGGQHMY